MSFNPLQYIPDSELEERIASCLERRTICANLACQYGDMASRGQEFAEKAEKYKVMGYNENTLLVELRAEKARRGL